MTLQNTPPSSLAIFSPSSSFRSKMPTLTPCEASRRAVAAPRPEAPPVMTAEIDESSFMSRFPCPSWLLALAFVCRLAAAQPRNRPLVCRRRKRPFGQAARTAVRPCTICYRQPRIKLLTGKGRSMDVLGQLQVVDLTDGIAGPITGMFMADFGAEVIKIEPPGGDPGREQPGFSMWNRGKKSVIDRSGQGRPMPLARRPDRRLRHLHRPGRGDVRTIQAVERGLERTQCAAAHRQDAALCADHAVASAAMSRRRCCRRPAASPGVSRRPTAARSTPCFRICCTCRALWATVCTVAALIEREKSGFGQTVSVTGINAVMEAAVGAFTVNPDNPDPSTAVGTGGRHPTYTRYATKDGQWISCGALGGKFETWLINALGLGDMLKEERMGGNIANIVLATNVDWAKEKIQKEFLKHNLDDLIKMITDLGIPCGKIGPTEKWLDHPQVKAIGMRAEVKDPKRGELAMPGIPINLTEDARQGARPGAGGGRAQRQDHGAAGAAAAGQDAGAAAGPARRLPHPRHGHVRRRSLLRLAAVRARRRRDQGRAADRRSVPRHRLHLQSRHAQRRHGPAEQGRARSLLRDGQDQRRRHQLAAARRDQEARHRLSRS